MNNQAEQQYENTEDTKVSPHQWYAVQVRTRWEGSTESLLRDKGFTTFLPTYGTTRKSNGKILKKVAKYGRLAVDKVKNMIVLNFLASHVPHSLMLVGLHFVHYVTHVGA